MFIVSLKIVTATIIRWSGSLNSHLVFKMSTHTDLMLVSQGFDFYMYMCIVYHEISDIWNQIPEQEVYYVPTHLPVYITPGQIWDYFLFLWDNIQ